MIQITWLPVLDDADVSQFIAESDQPFRVTVHNEGDVRQVGSGHDGLVHFVSVDVPLDASVEVVQ